MKGMPGKLIIRRHRQGDKSTSFFTAMEMAKCGLLCKNSKSRGSKPYYVVVRRGLPVDVMAAGMSKLDLKRRFLPRWPKAEMFFKLPRKAAAKGSTR